MSQTGYYITDGMNYRMRDSKDELFTCGDMEEVESVISYYFDVGYGDEFHVFDSNDELVDIYHMHEDEQAEDTE